MNMRATPQLPTARRSIEDRIERLVALLDEIDGDADFEPVGDAEPSLGWPPCVCFSAPARLLKKEDKLFRAIEMAAAVFVDFLEIHPFANGNGHMARMILICLLGRHGIYPNAAWSMHPRPSEPAYTNAIVLYRKGKKAPLHVLLLSCL